MAETYFPFDAGAGASTTEDGWAKMARLWLRTGVLQGELNGLAVTAPGSGMTVNVASGRAFIEGFFYENSATKAISIAAADPTNPRIDRIVARLDRTANTITAMVITGTPAGSPAAPVGLATSTQWDVTLATVLVGAAVVVVASDKVTDLRSFATPIVDRLDLRSSVDTPSDVGLRRTGAGAAQLDGALTVTNTLHAVGAATLDAALGVAGALTVNSTLHAVGAATLDSTLNVGSTLTVAGGIKSTGPGGTPRLYLKSTDSASDAKVWDMLPVSNALLFRTINDAENASNTWMTVNRSGYNLSSVVIGPTLNLGADIQIPQLSSVRSLTSGGRLLYHDAGTVYVGEIDSVTSPRALRLRTQGGEAAILTSSTAGFYAPMSGYGINNRFGVGSSGASGVMLDIYADAGAADVWLRAMRQDGAFTPPMKFRADTFWLYDQAGGNPLTVKDAATYGGSQSTPLFLYANGSFQQVITRSGSSIRNAFQDSTQFLCVA